MAVDVGHDVLMSNGISWPQGWKVTVHPWHALDGGVKELPRLVQVGPILVPEFFHLIVDVQKYRDPKKREGLEETWSLFINFQVYEDTLEMMSAEAWGKDISMALASLHTVVRPERVKPMAIQAMTQYLATFALDEDLPEEGWGARNYPGSEQAVEWLERLQNEAADAYAVARNMPMPGKRHRLTDDFLKEVARVYTMANNAGEAPTREVANHFKKPHSTAAKWVANARKKNFLPPVDA